MLVWIFFFLLVPCSFKSVNHRTPGDVGQWLSAFLAWVVRLCVCKLSDGQYRKFQKRQWTCPECKPLLVEKLPLMWLVVVLFHLIVSFPTKSVVVQGREIQSLNDSRIFVWGEFITPVVHREFRKINPFQCKLLSVVSSCLSPSHQEVPTLPRTGHPSGWRSILPPCCSSSPHPSSALGFQEMSLGKKRRWVVESNQIVELACQQLKMRRCGKRSRGTYGLCFKVRILLKERFPIHISPNLETSDVGLPGENSACRRGL